MYFDTDHQYLIRLKIDTDCKHWTLKEYGIINLVLTYQYIYILNLIVYHMIYLIMIDHVCHIHRFLLL